MEVVAQIKHIESLTEQLLIASEIYYESVMVAIDCVDDKACQVCVVYDAQDGHPFYVDAEMEGSMWDKDNGWLVLGATGKTLPTALSRLERKVKQELKAVQCND
jgi:hypothetical protein